MQVDHIPSTHIDNDIDTNALASVAVPAIAGSSFYVTAIAAGFAGAAIPTVPVLCMLSVGGDTDFLVPVSVTTPLALSFTHPLKYNGTLTLELPAGGAASVGYVSIAGYYRKD